MGEIERYRREHGIADQEHALGPKPAGEHVARRSAEIRLRDKQTRLGLSREAGKARAISRGPSLGR